MKVTFFAATLALVLGVAGTAHASCDEDSIETVSEDGDMIVLSSGLAFDVDAGDQADASLWQEGEDVVVCGDTLINKDENGEKISVTPH